MSAKTRKKLAGGKIPGRISPSDALRLSGGMAAEMESGRAGFIGSLKHLSEDTLTVAQLNWTGAVANLRNTEHLQHSDVGMTRMIHAAALTSPAERLCESDLPAREGVVFFAEAIEVNEDGKTYQVCAVSWTSFRSQTQPHGQSTPHLFISIWEIRNESIVLVGVETASDSGGISAALVRSIAAMNRSPLTGDRPDKPKRTDKSGTPATITAPKIRRSYLRKPELADMELAAARDKNYQPMRGHWVRGFWRKQWFPATEEHRSIWIDGHLRGDFTLGTVTGQKVLIGKGDRPAAAAA